MDKTKILSIAESAAAIMEAFHCLDGLYDSIYKDHTDHQQGFIEVWHHVARAATALEKVAMRNGRWIRLDGAYPECIEDYARQLTTDLSLSTCRDVDLWVLARKTFIKYCE